MFAVVASKDHVDNAVAVRLDRDDRDLAGRDKAAHPQTGPKFVKSDHEIFLGRGQSDRPQPSPRLDHRTTR